MAAIRTTRSSARPAAVLAVLTLLAVVAALLALSGTAHAAGSELPDDFEYQEDAQAVLDADRDDPNNLDSNRRREGLRDAAAPGHGTARRRRSRCRSRPRSWRIP